MLPKAMHALHAVHPYETPAVDVVPLVSPGGAPKPGDPGSGRVVDLPRPIAPRALAKRIAAGL